MPATKKQPAKQAKSQKPVKAAPAPVELTKAQVGRVIQDAMNGLTVEAIAAKTGFSVARVQEHVAYECSKGRSKMSGKKVVVVSSPTYRK